MTRGYVDLRTAIHHHANTLRLGLARGVFVNHPKLHPDRAQARKAFQGVIDDFGNSIGSAEDIHHVDGKFLGNGGKIGINHLTQNLLPCVAGIDRDNPVAFGLKELRHLMRGAVGFGRYPHHRDDAGIGQDLAQGIGVGVLHGGLWFDQDNFTGRLQKKAPEPRAGRESAERGTVNQGKAVPVPFLYPTDKKAGAAFHPLREPLSPL